MKFIILFLLAFTFCGKIKPRVRSASNTNQNIIRPPKIRATTIVASPSNYQFYIFATQWAGSSCALKRCTHRPPRDIFNIHGLWPTNGNTSPQNCAPFNFNENNIDASFRTTLYNFWNGYHGTNWGFVKYELSKHGTCWQRELPSSARANGRILPILNSYDSRNPFSKYNLFLKISVELSKILDIFNTLKAGGVLPDDNRAYQISLILSIMNNKLGLQTGVIPVCERRTSLRDTLLLELRFCADFGYNFFNCNVGAVQRGINYCGANGVKMLKIL